MGKKNYHISEHLKDSHNFWKLNDALNNLKLIFFEARITATKV